MKFTFDPAKRGKALAERGLDFADAAKVFAGRVATREDTRFAYGETRYVTRAGWMAGLWSLSGRSAAMPGTSSQ